MNTAHRLLLAPVLALALPLAQAGSLEEPEVVDVAGDCAFAPGNEYGDLVAVWISDETAADFRVNIALAKWTEPLGEDLGISVQFTHQGKEWGVVAFYAAAFGGWSYSTAHVTEDAFEGFEDTEGSFTPGTPALLSILFPKDIFPHSNATDNALHGFWAGTADLKAAVPFFFVPLPPAVPFPIIGCDEAVSDAVYEFTVGEHTAHGTPTTGTPPANGTAPPTTAAAEPTPGGAGPAGEPTPAKTPAPAAALALAALGAAAAARRRRA